MEQTIGNRIYNRRKLLHYTMDELGQKVGVTKSTVSKWEKGQIMNFNRNTLERLATVLECSIEWLIDPEDTTPAGYFDTVTFDYPNNTTSFYTDASNYKEPVKDTSINYINVASLVTKMKIIPISFRRINHYFKKNNINTKVLTAITGISPDIIERIQIENTYISKDNLNVIAQSIGIDPINLIDEQGVYSYYSFIETSNAYKLTKSIKSSLASSGDSLTLEEIELLEKYRATDGLSRAMVKRTLGFN